MLWYVSHPFQSIIEAGPSIASVRSAMIDKIRKDPGAFITKITPAEPSAKGFGDLGRQVFGMR